MSGRGSETRRRESQVVNQLADACSDINTDDVGREVFLTFHIKNDWEQSSAILKKDGGTNMRRPDVRATSVSIQLEPIPEGYDADQAYDAFQEFVTEKLPRRPSQYNATEGTAWVSYSNLSTEDFVSVVRFISKNWNTETVYEK